MRIQAIESTRAGHHTEKANPTAQILIQLSDTGAQRLPYSAKTHLGLKSLVISARARIGR
jgi:hypothetical protein